MVHDYMMPGIADNTEAYHTINWVLENGEAGFFIVSAPTNMQRKIADMYKDFGNVAIYDYSVNNAPYCYETLNEWFATNQDKQSFFLVNMQLAFNDEDGFFAKEHMLNFNLSRDPLAQKEKMYFFFMTPEADAVLSSTAFDLYSFVMQKACFLQEEPEYDYERYHKIMDFEDNQNIVQIKKTLKRYKKLENEYMALPVDEVNQETILAAIPTLTAIAELYKNSFEFHKALEVFDKARILCEKALGENHLTIAAVYANIADVYRNKGDYQKSLEWDYKALNIKEETLGIDHPDTATIYSNIALGYRNQGNYEEALKWYYSAMQIKEKIIGKEHPGIASICNNIAQVYDNQNNYPRALEWYYRALGICERKLGTNHINTAIIYDNIAGVYNIQGDYSKALELSYKALNIAEKILDKEHPIIATTYNNIALVYTNQGNYPAALEWLYKALDIRERVLGKEHPSTSTTYSNIAGVHEIMNSQKSQ